MVLVILLCVGLGGLLVWALYAEPDPPRPAPTTWTWRQPDDLRRHRFPLVPAGYDPRAVDAHLARAAALVAHLQRQLAAADASRSDLGSGPAPAVLVADDAEDHPATAPGWPAPPPPAEERGG